METEPGKVSCFENGKDGHDSFPRPCVARRFDKSNLSDRDRASARRLAPQAKKPRVIPVMALRLGKLPSNVPNYGSMSNVLFVVAERGFANEIAVQLATSSGAVSPTIRRAELAENETSMAAPNDIAFAAPWKRPEWSSSRRTAVVLECACERHINTGNASNLISTSLA
jgi:hypothetical protein